MGNFLASSLGTRRKLIVWGTRLFCRPTDRPSDRPSLVLNEENVNDQCGSFLDIAVNIVDERFVTKIYDKRDDFNFEIVNYPDLSGNIPRRQAYGVYTSQVLRYAKVCSKCDDFMKCLNVLTGKLIRKGFKKNELENTLSK